MGTTLRHTLPPHHAGTISCPYLACTATSGGAHTAWNIALPYHCFGDATRRLLRAAPLLPTTTRTRGVGLPPTTSTCCLRLPTSRYAACMDARTLHDAVHPGMPFPPAPLHIFTDVTALHTCRFSAGCHAMPPLPNHPSSLVGRQVAGSGRRLCLHSPLAATCWHLVTAPVHPDYISYVAWIHFHACYMHFLPAHLLGLLPSGPTMGGWEGAGCYKPRRIPQGAILRTAHAFPRCLSGPLECSHCCLSSTWHMDLGC